MKSPGTVLVVDDDSAGRAMLSLSLRQAGFSARTAATGEEALRMLQKGRCDWLVTDARMQPMSGFELSVKARKVQPDLRIVMVSALYTPKDVAGYPVEKFFSKPLSIEDLVSYLTANAAAPPAA